MVSLAPMLTVPVVPVLPDPNVINGRDPCCVAGSAWLNGAGVMPLMVSTLWLAPVPISFCPSSRLTGPEMVLPPNTTSVWLVLPPLVEKPLLSNVDGKLNDLNGFDKRPSPFWV